MASLKDIESQVAGLPPQALSEFRDWFARFDAELWDRQLEQDIESGKLDAMAAESQANYEAGHCRKI